MRAVKEQYLGKPVAPKYRKEYGKVYDIKEVKRVAYKIARARGWRV